MPNWCHNTLRVSGDPREVELWVSKARVSPRQECEEGMPLYFSAFVPEPKGLGNDWWDWRVENWGTKWEPSFGPPMVAFVAEGGNPNSEKFPVRYREDFVEYDFHTAWGPPATWLENVSEQYPRLNFSLAYGEPGMDFGGKVVYEGGEIISDQEGTAEEFLREELLWF